MNFFFGNNDEDNANGLDTFMNDDGDIRFGMKMGNDMGVDIETGNTYMKIDNNFGIDL